MDQKQIPGAIIIAALIIGGAILLKGNQPTGTGTQRKLSTSTAKVIGLNQREFKACLASGKYKDKVQADINDGSQAGVQGTPTSFIVKGGVVVDTIKGAQPLETVKQQVAAARSGTKNESPQIRAVSPGEHIIGNLNGDITIVEYSDLECPFCKRFQTTMHEVLKSDPNIAWVYRHYPIPQLHSKALHEAEATECAWEQGGNEAFWKYTDRIYEITPSNNGLEEAEL